MTECSSALRLIFPHWQGADISGLIPELEPDEASTGYYLGAELLNFLAPENPEQKTVTVPVSLEVKDRKIQDGILDRDIILEQTKDALNILQRENPDRIVTLGGECSVSVVPFTYLAAKYEDDVAVVWIDAHPDITMPGDVYPAYHAMAVAALVGRGDDKIMEVLPAKIVTSKILYAGIRDWERYEIKLRQQEFGIKHLTAEDIRNNPNAINNWIKSTGAGKVLIHFDMDVLEPSEIIPAAGIVPDGMKISEVTGLINNIAKSYNVAGLTVAEPMPRIAIKLRKMLQNLPLLS